MRYFSRLLAALLIAAKASGGTIDYTHDQFSITIPPDWVSIPEAEVSEKFKAIRKASPGATVPDSTYGYQARSEKWFSYPYVLVWVKRSGRTPEHHLQKLAKVDAQMSSDRLLSSADGLVSQFEMGKIAYDSTTHIIWMNSEATYPGVGKVDILNGSVQTEEGVIWVYGFALRDTFDSHKPTFVQITESIRPSEELRYKPRLTDNALGEAAKGIDWNKVVAKGLGNALVYIFLGVIIAGVIWLKSVFRSRKNSTPIPPRNDLP